jgi:hypothetical protein
MSTNIAYKFKKSHANNIKNEKSESPTYSRNEILKSR